MCAGHLRSVYLYQSRRKQALRAGAGDARGARSSHCTLRFVITSVCVDDTKALHTLAVAVVEANNQKIVIKTRDNLPVANGRDPVDCIKVLRQVVADHCRNGYAATIIK
jgi:hypothetical protein